MLNFARVAKSGPAKVISPNIQVFYVYYLLWKRGQGKWSSELLLSTTWRLKWIHVERSGPWFSGSDPGVWGRVCDEEFESWQMLNARLMRGKSYLWVKSKLLFSVLVLKLLTYCLMSLWAGNFHNFPVVNVVWCCTASLSIFPTFSVFFCVGSKLLCCKSNAGRSSGKSADPWTLSSSSSFSFWAEIKN